MPTPYKQVIWAVVALAIIIPFPTLAATTESPAGQTAGVVDFFKPQPANAQVGTFLLGNLGAGELGTYLVNKIFGTNIPSPASAAASAAADAAGKTIESGVSNIIFWMAYWLAKLGNYLLHQVAFMVGLLLGARKFVTNPLVQTGWPFVQGIANIGFILALLFIALTVALRLENFNAKKLLPRLLIAALLINFSLLIGGIMIDSSRLLMAIMSNTMGSTSVENLPVKILNRSNIFGQAFNLLTPALNPEVKSPELSLNTDNTLDIVIATVFIWGLLAAFFTLMIGLFMRYIILIILLIVSPIAYLSFAFPGAEGLAKRWWSEFIKYVFYGPIVLFMLVLLVGITNAAPLNANNLFGVNLNNRALNVQVALNDIISATITIGMLIAATMVGQYLGVRGSSTAVGWVSGAYKRAGRAGLSVGRTGLGVATYLPRKAGSAVAGAAKNQAKDFIGVGKSAFRDYAKANPLLSPFVTSKRNEKGELKPGETSLASGFANRLFQPQGKKRDQQNAVSNLMARDFGVTNDNIRYSALAAPMLAQEHVINGLGSTDDERFSRVKDIVQLGTMSQVNSLLKNTGYLRGLSDQQRTELQLAVENKTEEYITVPPPVGSPPGTPSKTAPRAVNVGAKDKALENLINAFAKLDEK